MSHWSNINYELKLCLKKPNPIPCLEELYNKTDDGWIAANLAFEYKKLKNWKKAYEIFTEAYEKLPKERYKQVVLQNMDEIKPLLRTLETLYIVNCTKTKIWGENTEHPKYVEAKEAYRGESILNWRSRQVSVDSLWLILSAKYGFIEPDHPISNYDVSFSTPSSGPISVESLKNQVMFQKRFEVPLKEFTDIEVYGSSVYYKKVLQAFDETNASVKQLVYF